MPCHLLITALLALLARASEGAGVEEWHPGMPHVVAGSAAGAPAPALRGSVDGQTPAGTNATSECLDLRDRNNVVKGFSWGTLKGEGKKLWKSLACDAALASVRGALALTQPFPTHAHAHAHALSPTSSR